MVKASKNKAHQKTRLINFGIGKKLFTMVSKSEILINIMPYVSQLGTGQQVYLDNQGDQTILTLVSSSSGQQQQSSNSLTTGSWTAPPQVYQSATGIIIKIYTETGAQAIQVQGGSMSLIAGNPASSSARTLSVDEVTQMPNSGMSPMKPMQPLPPMPGMPPMEMKMGNMQMSMNSQAGSTTRNFCSQCGAGVQAGDRFCASCGHKLI